MVNNNQSLEMRPHAQHNDGPCLVMTTHLNARLTTTSLCTLPIADEIGVFDIIEDDVEASGIVED